MSRKMKRGVVTVLVAIVVLLLILQLQPFIVRARDGVDGSLGFRPMSHDCLGFVSKSNAVSYLPFGELQFQILNFKYRYNFTKDIFDSEVDMCAGQDIWFGE